MFHRDDKADLSMEMKQFILAEMKEVGSLNYTMNLLEELFSAMIAALDTVEAKLGLNKKLRIFLLLLKV
jgi:geranylgeranyl diphosphate synthase type 3